MAKSIGRLIQIAPAKSITSVNNRYLMSSTISSSDLIDMNQYYAEQQLPLHLFNITFLQQHFFLPLKLQEQSLLVAITAPIDKDLLAEIQFHCGLTVEYLIYTPQLLQQIRTSTLNSYAAKTQQRDEADELARLIKQIQQENNHPIEEADNDQAPIARLLEKILGDALQQSASDIHFESYQHYYRIRFRCDGILYTHYEPPIQLAPRLTTRLKIMAQLNIAEQRLPQDGRCKVMIQQREVNIRISTCPMLNGEKIVLRLLEAMNLPTNLANLGLSAQQQTLLLQALHKSQGMILVTGPTGSGKTMTLYNALNLLNQPCLNILSIEDPIEIYLPGINQLAVNPKTGLDFPTALRSFLRQDPDVIMLGEMRDTLTADIALKAAQTGHLVLSTLHTNSAVETISRLLHMGIMPYQIASSITLIIAQRLVRKLCGYCKKLTSEKILGSPIKQHYLAVGCLHCKDGYLGRMGVYEILPVSPAVQEIILRNGTTLELLRHSAKEKLWDLATAGIKKVADGITSFNEVLRVTNFVPQESK